MNMQYFVYFNECECFQSTELKQNITDMYSFSAHIFDLLHMPTKYSMLFSECGKFPQTKLS